MSTEMKVILAILAVNAVIAVIYLIVGLISAEDRRKVIIYFILMILVPVFFTVYVLCSRLMGLVTGLMHVDLSDVTFGKDRIKSLERGNAAAENNLVPMEEALAVSDQASLRAYMLTVLKGDVSDFLGKLREALGSDDTETAHYAATVLRDELNRFRSTVYRSLAQIRDADGREKDELCVMTIRYIDEYLEKDLFSDDETEEYATDMADLADTVFSDDYSLLAVQDMYHVCMRLLSVRDYDRCGQWCVRIKDVYPDTKERYIAQISYAFETGRGEEFRESLTQLMDSGIPVDEDTMRHIRAFR